MNRRLFDFLTTTLGQHPNRVTAFLDTLDDAAAAKLVAAADAGDNRAVLKAMSEQTWGATPGRPAPAPVEPNGSRSPMSFEDRVANDPNIRKAVDAAGINVPAGDTEALLKAYRGAAPKRGRPKKAEDSIRELAKPADQAAAESIARQFDRAVPPAAIAPEPAVEVVRPTIAEPAPIRLADDMTFDEVPARPATPKPSKKKFPVGAAAAGAGGAAGVGLMMKGRQKDLVESGNPAELQDAPVSATSFSDETTGGISPRAGMQQIEQAAEPADYSLQARELINKLNAMRRAAGGEVPEAKQMMQEINRLIAMGNEQRRAPSYSHPASDPARDPYQQARNLIAQVNNMYRAGYTPNSPEVQRVMAEVRRLQSQGDAIRNRRVG